MKGRARENPSQCAPRMHRRHQRSGARPDVQHWEALQENQGDHGCKQHALLMERHEKALSSCPGRGPCLRERVWRDKARAGLPEPWNLLISTVSRLRPFLFLCAQTQWGSSLGVMGDFYFLLYIFSYFPKCL